MDDIRKFACQLAQMSGAAVKNSATTELIKDARLWEDYLRSPVPGAQVLGEETEADEPELDFQPSEDAVLAAMLGEHPDAMVIVERARAGVATMEEALQRMLGDEAPN